MTTFVQTARPQQHPGVARAERTLTWAKGLPGRIDGTRAGATFLLAAIVAALVVVANQVIETWTEGHLLVAWIVGWAVAFAGLALLAAPARRAAHGIRAGFALWQAARRRRAADEQLWNAALLDARVMADLSRAMSLAAERDVKSL